MPRRRTVQLAVILASGTILPVTSAASAATIEGVNGAAVFTAAPGERNVVTAGTLAFRNEPSLKVVDSKAPLTATGECQNLDDHTAWCPEDIRAARALVVWAGDRNDHVTVNDGIPREVTLHGQGGADTLHVGSSTGGKFVLTGDAGDDTLSTAPNNSAAPGISGGPGDDLIRLDEGAGGHADGGSGDDTIHYSGSPPKPDRPLNLDGGEGNDTYTFDLAFVPNGIQPGAGIDTLDQRNSTRALQFSTADCPSCVEVVVGTAAADDITGDDDAEALLGGPGDDHLDGGGGSDVIFGQAGDDTIAAQDGVIDAVRCGAGADIVMSADPFDLVSRSCEIRS